ncbi:MAG: arylesterase [Elusimicrobia bacterium]|nr:arylesterase [Elusimicrobiota bacterium]
MSPVRPASRLWLSLALGLGCSPAPEPPKPPPAPSPPAGRDVFLFLGDSLVAGYGVAAEDAFPALLEERWRREAVPWRARNAGVSGSTTAGVLENLDWTLAADVHSLFLCVGANDGLRGLDLESSRANLAAIVERARGRGVRVVLAGMKLPPNYGPGYTRRFERLYPELARRYGVALMPFLLEGVAGLKAMNVADGIHPNEAGHRRLADNVHAFLAREGLLRGPR